MFPLKHSQSDNFFATRQGSVSKLVLFSFSSVFIVVALVLLAFQLRTDAHSGLDHSKRLRIYCAASVVKPVAEIVQHFNLRNGTQVEIARTGGSGELIGQVSTEERININHGADLLVSADASLIEGAFNQGIFCRVYTIAQQRPVIATRKGNALSIGSINELLEDPSIRFAIASEHAAIGKLVRQLAIDQGLLFELENQKTTEAENVMTLAQALVTGSLDAAIVWDTTVHQVNEQSGKQLLSIETRLGRGGSLGDVAIGVTSERKNEALAESFCNFLARSEASRIAFSTSGFEFMGRPSSSDRN